MYDFFDKLVSVVLPRVKDFHGVKTTSLDGHGNYSLGFTEIGVFPEIDSVVSGRNLGIEITVRTSAKNNGEAKKLLELLGMPFRRTGK
jgi:large subunit ribosomal protein L5